nr:spore cortex biosynthesis protein YabQ [Sedimentibacter sp.]
MGGMFLGFIWDIYRLIRHYVKFGVVGTAAGDIAYWIISVYLSIQLIYDISYGNLRFFILMGFLLGAILYFYGISNNVLKVFIFCIDFILSLINKFISFMIYPIKFLMEKIRELLRPVRIKVEKGVNKAKRRYKFFKFRLKKVSKNRKMLYNKKKQMKKVNASHRRKGQKMNERRSKNSRAKKQNKQR